MTSSKRSGAAASGSFNLVPLQLHTASASTQILTILAKAFRTTAFVIGGTLVLSGFYFIKLSGR